MTLRLALLLAVLVAALPLLPADPGRSAFAAGEETLLARGAIDLFGEPMTWRIAEANLTAIIDDGGAPDPAGFALVERGSAGLSGLGYGNVSIDRGEAVFLPDRHSAEARGSPEDRTIVVLLARDREKNGLSGLRGDWPLHVGNAFAPPAGPYELRLLRIELAAGEASRLPPSPWPVTVVASSGGAGRRPGNAPALLLPVGRATTVEGGTAIEAGREDAVFHAATLVPQAPPAFWAGSIAVRVQSCPPQIQPPLPTDLACGPPDTMPEVRLRERGGYTVRGLSGARRSGDLLIWDWLGPGEYLLSVRDLPLGSRRVVVPGFAGTAAVPELGFDPGKRNGAFVAVTAGAVQPVSVFLIARPPARPPLDIAIRVFACPADVSLPSSGDPRGCAPIAPPTDLRLHLADEGRNEEPGSISSQERAGDWVVADVKPGPWLVTAELPAGFSEWTARASEPALAAVPVAGGEAILLGVNLGWDRAASATLAIYLGRAR